MVPPQPRLPVRRLPVDDEGLIRPCQDGVAGELATIATDHHLRLADTKSSDQRLLGAIGTIIGALVPIACLRPPRRRTASFSSR
jgi:hypothetical protein